MNFVPFQRDRLRDALNILFSFISRVLILYRAYFERVAPEQTKFTILHLSLPLDTARKVCH